MSSWEGRSKTTPLGYRIFVWVMKTFGLRPAYTLLYLVAAWYTLFARESNRHLRYYFRRRLGYGRWKALAACYRNYYIFGQSLIDKVALMAGLEVPFSYDFEGEEYLREMVSNGKGGLLISAHIGNWEIAGHLLKRLNSTINVVMYDGEDEQIKAYLESVTGGRNMKLILIKNDLSHIFAINEALANNELVCMHADRFVAGNKLMKANFLGEEAAFPAGPFILASRLKVPVSFVFAFKETASHYHLFSTAPRDYSRFEKSDRINTLLGDFVQEMEAKTKRYPLQWFNYYNFWKKYAD